MGCVTGGMAMQEITFNIPVWSIAFLAGLILGGIFGLIYKFKD